MATMSFRQKRPSIWVEFSLRVARAVLAEDHDLLDSTGKVSPTKGLEWGYVLANELNHIIQAGMKALARCDQAEMVIKTAEYGSFFVRASRMNDLIYKYTRLPAYHVEIETWEHQYAEFQKITDTFEDDFIANRYAVS